jgi:hypothetical protein
MPILEDQKAEWTRCQENNQDPYGKTIVNVARKLMEMLDEDTNPITPENVHNLITRADKESRAGGISGFMEGCVANIVSHAHSRGEEFRRARNGDVGATTGQENADGVLNPAILHVKNG